ncbi:MAG: histidine phosphatase family protein [Pseudomonadales bacterium]|nr:histidine phosphatase family protein [Pseudomonadales bacterium]
MKILYLLRHAKSSWDDPDLKDFERPLSDRGFRDAPNMGKRFVDDGNQLQCIITSPAMRAKTTAKLFAESIGFPADDIASNPELYFAGTGMFLKAASLLDESCTNAMLVGHNPAITEFANLMANCDIDNIPTCGLVKLGLDIDDWSEIAAGIAELLDFDYPKKSS